MYSISINIGGSGVHRLITEPPKQPGTMRYLSILTFCALCMLVVPSTSSNATQQNQDGVLMKNISDLHFQLFSSIQKRTKMLKV